MGQTMISLKELASVRRKHLNPLMIIWINSDCWRLGVLLKSWAWVSQNGC